MLSLFEKQMKPGDCIITIDWNNKNVESVYIVQDIINNNHISGWQCYKYKGKNVIEYRVKWWMYSEEVILHYHDCLIILSDYQKQKATSLYENLIKFNDVLIFLRKKKIELI